MATGFKSGGRQKGTPNKQTADVRAKLLASGESPLDFMLRIMRDEAAEYLLRADMAKSAAPYLHQKLAAIELTGSDGGPINVNITGDDAGLL